MHRVFGFGLVMGLLWVVGCGGGRVNDRKADIGEPGTKCERACRVWGFCKDDNGQCVASSDQQCEEAETCQTGGLCSFRDGRCMALSDADCTGSEWCDDYGWCSAEQGVCVR